MTSNPARGRTVTAARVVRLVIPSAISVVRVVLTILLLLMISRWPEQALATIILGVPIVFLLDAVDGIVARRLNSQTLPGSFIDIAADRLVEFIFLRHFILVGFIPLWFVWVFYGRIVLTDACRLRAFRMERVSSSGILLPWPWRFLVLSKLSRSTYAALKAALFGFLLLSMHYGSTSLSTLEFATMLGVLTFSLLRAIPILFTYVPRRMDWFILNSHREESPRISDIATRTTTVISWVQLFSDICLGGLLVGLAWR